MKAAFGLLTPNAACNFSEPANAGSAIALTTDSGGVYCAGFVRIIVI